MIYRSGELSQLTDADLEQLHRLGIRTVVDFRSAYEVETRGPDRLPEGARSVAPAIDPGDLNSVLQEALSTGDFSALPPDYLTQVNRQLIAQHAAQYSQLLQLLLEPGNMPLVLHCTHGKDRAGIGSAIVLIALDALVNNIWSYAGYSKQAGKLPLGRQAHCNRNVESPDFGADWSLRPQVQIPLPQTQWRG